MGAENIKSFIRYYSRIADRIDQWIIQLIQKISEITNINNYKRLPFKEKSLKEKMQYFFKITKQYISVIDKLDSGVVVTKDNYILFILAVFSLSIKSLGP